MELKVRHPGDVAEKTEVVCGMQGGEALRMGQFMYGSVRLQIPDRNAQDDVQTAHDEALQPWGLGLLQYNALCAIG